MTSTREHRAPAQDPQASNAQPGLEQMVRLRLDLAYDGTPFDGWAAQPGRPTVQGTLEQALELVIRRPVRTVVAGRTDAGVHARGQVVHCDLTRQEMAQLSNRAGQAPTEVLHRRLAGTLSRVLGPGRREQGLKEERGAVVVTAVSAAPEGFDARFSARARRYTYRINDAAAGFDPLTRATTWWVRDVLDTEVMQAGLQDAVGLHDFLSFCRPREGATTVRELRAASVSRTEAGLVEITVEADAFCHNMVRSLVGAAVLVGRGERPIEWLGEKLGQRQRSSDMLLAPPGGLVLEAVIYPDDDEVAAQAARTRARREPVR